MLVKILNENAKLPVRGSVGSAGADLYSPIDEIILVGETKKIKLGLAIEINQNEVAIISERSSQGVKGIHSLGNVIDSDYRGEFSIILQNNSKEDYVITKGDRIGQIIVHKLGDLGIYQVDELSVTNRDSGGFGSTGK